jgi:hypothetical protein
MHPTKRMRRKTAAIYLQEKFGFGSVSTLAKGVVTGDSPVYQKAGRIVLYTPEALDAWALAKIGAPQKSSSDVPASRSETAQYKAEREAAAIAAARAGVA